MAEPHELTDFFAKPAGSPAKIESPPGQCLNLKSSGLWLRVASLLLTLPGGKHGTLGSGQMVKFVASVIAGLIATVLGGLILNHLSNPQVQETAPHNEISQTSSARIRIPDVPWQIVFPTYEEAKRACHSRQKVWLIDDDPAFVGRYLCH